MHKTRVLVADKNELFSQSLKLLLEKYTDIEITGTGNSYESLASSMHNKPFEVLLLDVNLLGSNVATSIAKLRELKATFRLMVMVNKTSDTYLDQYKDIPGVHAFLSKNADIDELITAIRHK